MPEILKLFSYLFPEIREESVFEDRDTTRKSSEEIRALWKKAILETLLLIRMEKENTTLLGKGGGRDLEFHYKNMPIQNILKILPPKT